MGHLEHISYTPIFYDEVTGDIAKNRFFKKKKKKKSAGSNTKRPGLEEENSIRSPRPIFIPNKLHRVPQVSERNPNRCDRNVRRYVEREYIGNRPIAFSLSKENISPILQPESEGLITRKAKITNCLTSCDFNYRLGS